MERRACIADVPGWHRQRSCLLQSEAPECTSTTKRNARARCRLDRAEYRSGFETALVSRHPDSILFLWDRTGGTDLPMIALRDRGGFARSNSFANRHKCWKASLKMRHGRRLVWLQCTG